MLDLRSPPPRAPYNELDRRVHTVRQELSWVAMFIGAIWAVFLLDRFLPLERFGLVPRQWSGLIGVVAMTFLHANWSHLLSNTVPLFILLTLLAGSRARSGGIVVAIILVGGMLLWLFGRTALHIGASLLIFGLITFLLASGLLFERRPVPVIVALIVGLLYGFTLLAGVLPRVGSGNAISWDGHLSGALAGLGTAYLLTRPDPRRAGTS
jgi:membrane associated rhomboid family serine protease